MRRLEIPQDIDWRLSAKILAEKHGVSITTIWKWRKTTDELKRHHLARALPEVAKLYQDGILINEITRITAVSRATIYRRRAALGLKLRKE